MVDELIDDLLLVGLKLGSRRSEQAAEDVAWWIATGRVPTQYVKALHSLDPEKLEKLIGKITKEFGSTDSNVRIARKFAESLV